ncbi:uncharacterized protein LAJ45_00340 [Morchella importuna]|uniref:uncharacterized protein n=1 Tax=Morchella importuna TaxID=1174673 RepID=UPI001E8D1E27|nr:uncharacterized protein LAJ45_00340 [Morchella importuna]KAH8155330.1 hypothetical protein LAJ45_00340 [Morchella importuna]
MAGIQSSASNEQLHTQDVVASSSLNNNLHLQHRPSSSQRQDGPSAPPPLTIGIGGGTSTARPTSSVNSISSRSISSPVNTIPDRGMGDSQQWKNVRTLPTWVQSREEDEHDLIEAPPLAHRRPPERSQYDAVRETTPITMGRLPEHASRWRNFVEASTGHPPATSHSEKDEPEQWLAKQGDFDKPWNHKADTENQGDGSADDTDDGLLISAKRRRIWYKRIYTMLLNNPAVPLTFRALIWVLSLLALALASSVFQLSNQYGFDQKPSTVMAIVVDVIALIYLIYITYDEYSGKPLGLRSPKAKMRLIMLDLLFIIFDSANLSLAFDTLFDVRWSCRSATTGADFGGNDNELRTVSPICDRQRALAAFIFLALCAWVSTFTVSVFRLVERVSKGNNTRP